MVDVEEERAPFIDRAGDVLRIAVPGEGRHQVAWQAGLIAESLRRRIGGVVAVGDPAVVDAIDAVAEPLQRIAQEFRVEDEAAAVFDPLEVADVGAAALEERRQPDVRVERRRERRRRFIGDDLVDDDLGFRG